MILKIKNPYFYYSEIAVRESDFLSQKRGSIADASIVRTLNRVLISCGDSNGSRYRRRRSDVECLYRGDTMCLAGEMNFRNS